MNWRKYFFKIHGWLGLNVGLLLFLVCLSGTFATLSDEVDWLLDARHRTPAPSGPVTDYDWTAMHETVAREFPGGLNLNLFVASSSGFRPAGERVAAVSYVALPNGQTRKVYLDPYTGDLRGHTSFFNVQRFFRTFHRRFFDGVRGILIITLSGFVLLGAAVTGFGFYKGWLKQLFTLRLGGTRRLRWSDLHKTAGVWGLGFTVIIAVTGIFYFVELAYQGADRYEVLLPPPLPQVAESELASFGPQPDLLPAGRYVEAAREAHPGLEVRRIRLSSSPSAAVYVDGYAGDPLTRDRANMVHLHPFTGAVLGIQRSGDLGLVPFVTDAVDPLHFGYFGGTWTQVLWAALGLLLSFSILSGSYVWVVRTITSSKTPSSWLRGAPISLGLTVGYVCLVAVGIVEGIQGYAPPGPEPVVVGNADVGPYDLRVECGVPCDLSAGSTLIAHFLGSGLPNYSSAEIVTPEGRAFPLNGPSRRPTSRVTSEETGPWSVRVTSRDGSTVHTGTFVPEPPSGPTPDVPTWPDTAPGVWWVVGAFLLLSLGSILVWVVWIVRAGRSARRSLDAARSRPTRGAPEGSRAGASST